MKNRFMRILSLCMVLCLLTGCSATNAKDVNSDQIAAQSTETGQEETGDAPEDSAASEPETTEEVTEDSPQAEEGTTIRPASAMLKDWQKPAMQRMSSISAAARSEGTRATEAIWKCLF